ncbi:MAG: ribosome silencing factor [Candidatus Promineifilaceae bacterium]
MIIDTIVDKKGNNIVLIDIRDQAVFTDYFLICEGDNPRQLQTISDSVAEEAKRNGGGQPWGIEGDADSGWILLDYGDVVVHVFSSEVRNYYRLEELWSSGHVVLRMQ